ncbi:MAG: UPF0280 family protein [Proteobacteria bacterium]|nr:UPF0280 family protein [Pseudomonadota bacterium]
MTGKPKKKKSAPDSFKDRAYRKIIAADNLVATEIKVRETDLHILAARDLTREATHLVVQYRNQLEQYIATHAKFLTSLLPVPFDNLAPPIAKDMMRAGAAAQVGPMAAVAGAIAEFVGKGLLTHEINEIMVENGGDIFLQKKNNCTVSIFAGDSPLSYKVGLAIPSRQMPLGICTSSGTVGHSLSLGSADSVTVLAPSTSLADAVATRLGNEIIKADDINRALGVAKSITGIIGAVIIRGDQLGAWGDIELVGLDD